MRFLSATEIFPFPLHLWSYMLLRCIAQGSFESSSTLSSIMERIQNIFLLKNLKKPLQIIFASDLVKGHSDTQALRQIKLSTPTASLITLFLLTFSLPSISAAATLEPPSVDIFTPQSVGSHRGQPPVNSLE